MREGLDRVVDALRLAAAGLDQLFERKGIKSHMMPNPDGHPWIRVMHPMDEVRFIGITPNRGDGPIYLKLRVFLYEQYKDEFDRLLLGKFFSFEGMEFIGITTAETKNPRQVLPLAVKQVVFRN